MTSSASSATRWRRIAGRGLLAVGLITLVLMITLIRLSCVTDRLYHSLVKDPERSAPEGRVIVAPADGHVLYVRRVTGGTIPEVIKRGVAVPMVDHFKLPAGWRPRDGYLVGIYMNTFGVHINRFPNHGRLTRQIIFNGPHMDMTDAETTIILTQLVPGLVSLRKLLGLSPYGIEQDADYVVKSARETLVMRDERGAGLYVTRIADYYVGKILTWVPEGSRVSRGQRMGMITWGSQTDLFIEESAGLQMTAEVGDYVYGGESVLATY
jgi:phosphatidylserine decarboxylase